MSCTTLTGQRGAGVKRLARSGEIIPRGCPWCGGDIRPDILVGLVGTRGVLTLDPQGAAITDLSTTYDAPTACLTITAATCGATVYGALDEDPPRKEGKAFAERQPAGVS